MSTDELALLGGIVDSVLIAPDGVWVRVTHPEPDLPMSRLTGLIGAMVVIIETQAEPAVVGTGDDREQAHRDGLNALGPYDQPQGP